MADSSPARKSRHLWLWIGIPVAATGLVDPIWAMLAMAVSVTAIFINSLWGRPALFVDAVLRVGRPSFTAT